MEPADQALIVEYDRGRMGLGDLVRFIEDTGTRVAEVAQRILR